MRKSYVLKMILVAAAAVLLLSGCRDSGPTARVFVKNGAERRMRIAVLPFDNVSRNPDAGRILTNTVVTYLLATNYFDVVEPGVVNASMQTEQIRLNEGVTLLTCEKLQPNLQADAFIVGLVEEFGEMRVGSDTYPSISFSARLVDARTAEILWAATISKTGADSVSVFDMGRVSSLGKLAKRAVNSMASSLMESGPDVWHSINVSIAAAEGGNKVEPGGEVALTTNPKPDTTPAIETTPTASTGASEAAPVKDAVSYGRQQLVQLLQETAGMKPGNVSYKKHFHDQVETKYQTAESGQFIDVKLVDYLKSTTSEAFMKTYHPDQAASQFESFVAYAGESEFDYYHLDIAAGRFGLFVSGPKDQKSAVESLAKGLISSLGASRQGTL